MIKQSLTLIVLLLFAASCGPLNKGGVGDAMVNIGRNIAAGGAPPAQPSAQMAQARPEDVRVITIRNQGRVVPVIQTGQNGPISTWRADEGLSFSFDRGVLVASRGLGYDLMGVTHGGFHTALGAGGGSYTREHATMGSVDQIILRTVACTLTRNGPEAVPTLTGGSKTLTRWDEACAGPTLVFDNEFWTDATGTIVRSKQAVSPSIGFVLVDQF